MTAAASGAPAANAGIGRRLGALIYEALIAAALVLVAGFALTPLMSPTASPAAGLPVPTSAGRMAGFALLVVGLGAFYVWSWSGGRRTLPMKTWRMRLVDAPGAPLATAPATLEEIAAAISARYRARGRAICRRVDRPGHRGHRVRGDALAPRVARPGDRLCVAAGRSRPALPARPARRDAHRPRSARSAAVRRNALSADHSGCAGACARASATPAAISTMPASASASSVSPNSIHAISAVTGGTR